MRYFYDDDPSEPLTSGTEIRPLAKVNHWLAIEILFRKLILIIRVNS